MRITPDNITQLGINEIFVFGSNLRGAHWKGAARTARQWGAVIGQASGLQGKTYAIPTKPVDTKKVLTIEQIKPFVDEFISFAKQHMHLKFYVTQIGCGLAGYKPIDIAPLFLPAIDMENVWLPQSFIIQNKPIIQFH